MKLFSNSDKLKAFIAIKMTYIITFLDNNGKSAVCTGGNIHGIYSYLEMIGAPTTLTTSGQCSRHFCPLSSIKSDTTYIQPFTAAIRVIQKSFCKCCVRIVYKADVCIICGPKFLPSSIRIKINPLNALRGEEPNEPPREWNSQPPASHFKYRTSPTKTSPVV